VVCAEVQDMADGALSPIAAAQLAASADRLVALLTTRITEVRTIPNHSCHEADCTASSTCTMRRLRAAYLRCFAGKHRRTVEDYVCDGTIAAAAEHMRVDPCTMLSAS